MADQQKTVITGATLVDGTGTPSRLADVAFENGIITEVGEPGAISTAHAHQHVRADGLLLTPGWVDVHTHYDAQATWDPWLTPSSWHGVTTAVMGNCGVGFAPANPDRHQWLIDLMEGVEDIPGSAMVEGITWEWTSFPEYLDALERSPHVIDFGTQIAHGALRAFVMGDRGANNEDATADDIAQMSLLDRTGPARGRTWFFHFAHFASPKQTRRVGARHFCAARRTVWHCRCNAARGARHFPIFPRTFTRASRRMAVDARACSTIWRNSQCQCQPIG